MTANLKFIKTVFLLFFLQFTIFETEAQNIDSLLVISYKKCNDTSCINAINQCAKYYRNVDADSSIFFANKAFAISQKIGFKKGIIQAQIVRGFWFQRNAFTDSSFKSYNEALRLSVITKDKNSEARATASLGDLYLETEKYTQAMTYFINAVKLFDALGDKRPLSTLYANLSQLNTLQGNDIKALEYLREGLKVAVELNDENTLAYSHLYLGNYFGEKKQYDSSNYYYQSAFHFFEISGNLHPGYAAAINIGINYNEQGNYKKAIDYYSKALIGLQSFGDSSSIASCKLNMGLAFANLKDFKNTMLFLNDALKMAKQLNDGAVYQKSMQYLSYAYTQKGDYKNALYYSNQFIRVKDSLLGNDARKQIAEMETKYQTEKKVLQIKNLKDEQQLKDSQLKQEKQIKFIVSIGLCLSLVLGFFVFIGFINKRKANRIIQNQKLEVEIKNKEINIQHHALEEKNKEITDSINYAKKIQDAILPSSRITDEMLPSNFIYYEPKDIVAGDFYWFESFDTNGEEPTMFLAAADCTGHGVPGALVSVVCSGALNRSVKEFGLKTPGEILDKARELVLETFAKSDKQVKDGMDISLVSIKKNSNDSYDVSWAGANNPFWFIVNGEFYEVKADKQPIGKTDNPTLFATHYFKFNKGDCFFMFTDGYADQFGGPKGKKLKYKAFKETLLNNYRLPVTEQKNELKKSFDRWKGSLEQVDDVLVIGVNF